MSAQSAASSSILYRNVHYPSYSPRPECRVSISTSFSLSLRSLRLASLSSTASCTWIVYSRGTCVATRPCRTRIPMLFFSPVCRPLHRSPGNQSVEGNSNFNFRALLHLLRLLDSTHYHPWLSKAEQKILRWYRPIRPTLAAGV